MQVAGLQSAMEATSTYSKWQLHDLASAPGKLRDFSWWPKVWYDKVNRSVSPTVIRNEAVLTNVRLSDTRLTLISQMSGATFTAKTDHFVLSVDFLILLRHILLQHYGEPISDVENILIAQFFEEWAFNPL
jgi:hypothetical protein